MISYEVYKILHLFGIMLLFGSIGGLCLVSMKADRSNSVPGRKLAAITHGVSLILILVAGFGLLARLGITGGGWPLWIWLKLIIWIALGGVVVLIKRMPGAAGLLFLVIPLLGAVAAVLAIYKPS
ncbi:MAG: hypothetical protein L0Y56_09520 [Nitrospira sp.]|nr:hypothetical protein [Nitrospira sp.]